MTIAEMHVWFRQYAQQMGMQNVRAILPEQIDNLINTSTKDTIDEVINRNVGITNDRVITDNSKLANINALRTLYKVKTLPIGDNNPVSHYKNIPYVFESTTIDNALYFVDFSVRYSDEISDVSSYRSAYNTALSNYKIALNNYSVNPGSSTASAVASTFNALLTAESNLLLHLHDDDALTRWFPIRIVDDAYLSDILNDWVLSPRMRTPVMVVYASDSVADHSRFELYLGENEETGLNAVASSRYISEIRCSYIKMPNKVQYLSDVGGTNINSDLPEQLQIPMLKHAVDLYRATIQGSLFAAQENAKEQQREAVRNNARPDNEGYQS